jgi:transposase
VDLTAQLLNLCALGSDPFEHFNRFTDIGKPEQTPPRRSLQVHHRLETQQTLEVIAAYVAGASIRELAAQFKINRATVLDHLRRHEVPRRPQLRKLSDKQIAEAAELYRDGWSLLRLGKHYGVDDETVRRALRRVGVLMRPRKGSS